MGYNTIVERRFYNIKFMIQGNVKTILGEIDQVLCSTDDEQVEKLIAEIIKAKKSSFPVYS